MTLRILAGCLFGSLIAVAQSQPQRPPRPPVAWWDNPVANGLELTEAQKTRVDRIRKDSTDRVILKRDAVDRAERELDAVFAAFNGTKADWDRAKLAIDALAQARGDLTKEMSIVMLKMRAVLTIDQWKMLESRAQSAPGRDRDKGRGRGFRGPGSVFNDSKP
jgi:Spy/CpxP family protein refolding chaperone